MALNDDVKKAMEEKIAELENKYGADKVKVLNERFVAVEHNNELGFINIMGEPLFNHELIKGEEIGNEGIRVTELNIKLIQYIIDKNNNKTGSAFTFANL